MDAQQAGIVTECSPAQLVAATTLSGSHRQEVSPVTRIRTGHRYSLWFCGNSHAHKHQAAVTCVSASTLDNDPAGYHNT